MIHPLIPQIITAIEQYGYPDDNGWPDSVLNRGYCLELDKKLDIDEIAKSIFASLQRMISQHNLLATKIPQTNEIFKLYGSTIKHERGWESLVDEYYIAQLNGLQLDIARTKLDAYLSITIGVKER